MTILIALAIYTLLVIFLVKLFSFSSTPLKAHPKVARMSKAERLSQKEREAIKKLQEVKNEGPWGVAIRQVLDTLTVAKFRELICCLKSQAADDHVTMHRILGPDAYSIVMDL